MCRLLNWRALQRYRRRLKNNFLQRDSEESKFDQRGVSLEWLMNCVIEMEIDDDSLLNSSQFTQNESRNCRRHKALYSHT